MFTAENTQNGVDEPLRNKPEAANNESPFKTRKSWLPEGALLMPGESPPKRAKVGRNLIQVPEDGITRNTYN